jgi:hypothetical protein
MGRVFGLLAALIAIAAIVVFGLAARGESQQTRNVRTVIRASQLYFLGSRIGYTGTTTGEPGGSGTVTMDQTFAGPSDRILKGPTPVTAKLTVRLPNGALTGTLVGTVTPTAQGGTRLDARITWTTGTGKYKRPSGTARITGGRQSSSVPIERFDVTGKVKS